MLANEEGSNLLKQPGERPTTDHQKLLSRDPRPPSDTFYYMLAMTLGIIVGWMEIKVGDLLFTALLVLAPCILLGALRPKRPWRWTVLVAIFVPLADLLAYFIMRQKPDRAEIYEAFLCFLPAIVGAYGGSFMRGVIRNLLAKE
jgi:hypothetical protein